MITRFASLVIVVVGLLPRLVLAEDWSKEQLAKLPPDEKIVRLFNGKDFSGWHGHTGKYFFAEDGVIVGRNTQENAPKSSTNPQDQLVTATSRDTELIMDGKAAESGMDETALAKIDNRMREFIDAKQIAGAVTLVARRGRVVHLNATGKADIANRRDMAKDTVFAIASMTKPITAALVMILVDEGKVQLD